MGKTKDTKIVVSSHIDTNQEEPIPYNEVGEEIHIRCACDDKGSTAAQNVCIF